MSQIKTSLSLFPICFSADPIFPALNFAGCYVNGQILAHGDHWREDDCTFCQCVSGEARCVAAACGHNCLHPVIVPGECCPVCEGKDRVCVCVVSFYPSLLLFYCSLFLIYLFIGHHLCSYMWGIFK